MSSRKEDTAPIDEAPPHPAGAGAEEPTGLPWLRSWKAVYWFVFGCFVVCVVLLTALTVLYS